MSDKVVKKIEKELAKKMSCSNFDTTDIQVSIIHNKAVMELIYSQKIGKEPISDKDIRKMMKIAKKILKNNEVQVMALSKKRKEAVKDIKFKKRLKKVRFVTIKHSNLFHPIFSL